MGLRHPHSRVPALRPKSDADPVRGCSTVEHSERVIGELRRRNEELQRRMVEVRGDPAAQCGGGLRRGPQEAKVATAAAEKTVRRRLPERPVPVPAPVTTATEDDAAGDAIRTAEAASAAAQREVQLLRDTVSELELSVKRLEARLHEEQQASAMARIRAVELQDALDEVVRGLSNPPPRPRVANRARPGREPRRRRDRRRFSHGNSLITGGRAQNIRPRGRGPRFQP